MARRAKIFYSLSKSIFENLAFEEWLFRNHCIDRFGDAILFWSNKPTVVIGRHQNPWLELDIAFVKQRRIDIVRRHSGGGAVYHDLGNVNISILTEQKNHHRAQNLKFIAGALNQAYNINVVPNTRDDLLLQPGERKISGTAARIAHSRAYHHMTLLVDTDLAVLKKSLKSPLVDKIRTNATASVRASAVGFLTQDDRSVTTQGVIATLTDALERHYEETEVLVVPDVVNEQQFPGVRENERLLRSWEWTFGKSPKFTIRLSDNIFHVEKGIVQKVEGSKVDTIGSQLPAIIEEL
ncbi:Lipoyltransferase 1, mitochondrial [Toxocara canis]|uniref:Lipoyltransferase 1, mitochondrial n=1 Tax=Toxocara canis TaxID=6265 RepID=A0A0B2VGG6_TOXCA|nr:Lipoyltransferase 1, mitochondrial [Toxocara canis]